MRAVDSTSTATPLYGCGLEMGGAQVRLTRTRAVGLHEHSFALDMGPHSKDHHVLPCV